MLNNEPEGAPQAAQPTLAETLMAWIRKKRLLLTISISNAVLTLVFFFICKAQHSNTHTVREQCTTERMLLCPGVEACLNVLGIFRNESTFNCNNFFAAPNNVTLCQEPGVKSCLVRQLETHVVTASNLAWTCFATNLTALPYLILTPYLLFSFINYYYTPPEQRAALHI